LPRHQPRKQTLARLNALICTSDLTLRDLDYNHYLLEGELMSRGMIHEQIRPLDFRLLASEFERREWLDLI